MHHGDELVELHRIWPGHFNTIGEFAVELSTICSMFSVHGSVFSAGRFWTAYFSAYVNLPHFEIRERLTLDLVQNRGKISNFYPSLPVEIKREVAKCLAHS